MTEQAPAFGRGVVRRVDAFLEERIRFADIAEIVAASLDTLDLSMARDVEELVAADAQTRAFAEGALSRA